MDLFAPTNLLFDDRADTSSCVAVLTASSLTGLAPDPISYQNDNIQFLTLDGGSGGNQINVQSTPAFAGFTVNAGSGNNTILVGDANTLDGIGAFSDLSVVGQGGANRLILNDQADTNSENYSANNDIVFIRPELGISYFGMTSFQLNAAQGGNTFNIYSTALRVSVQCPVNPLARGSPI
jgi:hypothetical protein